MDPAGGLPDFVESLPSSHTTMGHSVICCLTPSQARKNSLRCQWQLTYSDTSEIWDGPRYMLVFRPHS
jgi:hypothetical protein